MKRVALVVLALVACSAPHRAPPAAVERVDQEVAKEAPAGFYSKTIRLGRISIRGHASVSDE